MSEKSQEILLSIIDEPAEMDSDETEREQRINRAIYESSKVDIRDHINHEDFKYVWLVSRDDIRFQSIKHQRIFSEQILDKISEVYDFVFPQKISLDTQYDITEFYQFLEFIEYDNIEFLSYVWKILRLKNLLDLNLETYCKSNVMKIIREVEEQVDVHPQPKLIKIFLSSLYKDAFIEWFIKNTKQSIVDIQVKILS